MQDAGAKANAAKTAPKKSLGPTGIAFIGEPSVNGGSTTIKPTSLAAVLKRFGNCFRVGLHQNPELQGGATLVAKIGAQGQVLGVTTRRGGSVKLIVPCLEAVLNSAQFEPPTGSKSATVTIPLLLRKLN